MIFPLRRALRSLLASSLLLLSGCVTQRGVLETPAGFAHYADRELYTIVSPEHVVVRVRTAENDPPQNLEFWAATLERHLTDSGYSLLDEGSFDAAPGPGVRFEWVAPVGEEDWVYLTAILVAGESIVIIEGAGPYPLYQEHRTEIIESLATVELVAGR